MSFPVIRTVVIVPPWTQVYRWPIAQPDDVLDYSLDMSAALADASDTIETVSVSAMPSGAGELALNSVSFTGGLITIWASGGVAGRTYIVQFVVMTTGGRSFVFLVALPISAQLAGYPIPLPPVPGYSTAITT